MLRTSAAQRLYRRTLVAPPARLCLRAGIGQAEISISAVLLAMAGGVAFVFEPAVGGALYLISGWLDTLDGAVSRAASGDTRAGAFLDSMLDRYTEFIVLLGILGFYARADHLSIALTLVVFLGGFGSWMVSYAQARAEGLGSSCSFGFFERPERVLLLGLGAAASRWVEVLLPLPDFLGTRPLLGGTLLLLALGTNATAFARLVGGYRTLQSVREEPR